jgi:glutamate formiminotransferase/glutamate formiminotransferase/formiminotetrahydrofolate cyclodeaminase
VVVEPPILLSVPNVSEGRDAEAIAEIGRAFEGSVEGSEAVESQPAVDRGAVDVRLLDVHSDRDHHRSVFTLAGRAPELSDALLRGGRTVVERVDVMTRMGLEGVEVGQHPHVGALDVVPIVYLALAARGAALAVALLVADRIGEELQVPVFLYGALSGCEGAGGRTRAELRRGGIALLARRIAADSLRTARPSESAVVAGALESVRPDFGPSQMHPSAGATLVAARPPLVAFNVQLAAPATVADARRIASLVREGGSEGIPGLRAIGVALSGDVSQVSMNIERPLEVSLAMVVEAVGRHAHVESAELVGLAPGAVLDGFPEDVPLLGFDPARHVIENAIGW